MTEYVNLEDLTNAKTARPVLRRVRQGSRQERVFRRCMPCDGVYAFLLYRAFLGHLWYKARRGGLLLLRIRGCSHSFFVSPFHLDSIFLSSRSFYLRFCFYHVWTSQSSDLENGFSAASESLDFLVFLCFAFCARVQFAGRRGFPDSESG